jgi:hypothetical protein
LFTLRYVTLGFNIQNYCIIIIIIIIIIIMTIIIITITIMGPLESVYRVAMLQTALSRKFGSIPTRGKRLLPFLNSPLSKASGYAVGVTQTSS